MMKDGKVLWIRSGVFVLVSLIILQIINILSEKKSSNQVLSGVEYRIENSFSFRDVPKDMLEYRGGYRYGFSLLYPKNLSVEEYDGWGGSRTIVFQDEAMKIGFQVYVVNYSESKISDERFKEDIPSGVRKNVTSTLIDGHEATSFESFDKDLGETKEIWFVDRGRLFEITTPKGLESWLDEILKNWVFV